MNLLTKLKHYHILTILLLVAVCTGLILYHGKSVFSSETSTVSGTKKLSVPFASQAPRGIWKEPWANACEETATLMIDQYYKGNWEEALPINTIEKEIVRIIKLENQQLGLNIDTNARQMAEIINLYFPWEATTKDNPTLEEIKKQIDLEQPVIIPAHGRDLHNPYFKTAQIDYHVFVLSGYDDTTEEFIVQEPGLRNGLNFRYSYDTIMTALHDFIPADNTYQGEKIAVFTRAHPSHSASSDGDGDGLTKVDEIRHRTSLTERDSDGDGIIDGTEVKFGYSPTLHETRFVVNGALVKTQDQNQVYYLENGTRRWIISEEVFTGHGWKGSQILDVSTRFLNEHFPEGDVLEN